MANKTTREEITTLIACLLKARRKGYVIDYTISKRGLAALNENRFYNPREIKVKKIYRFENIPNQGENSVLYLLETYDGNKGTLTHTYGANADPVITEFMKNVERIENKNMN